MAFALRVESPMLVRVAVIAGACVLGAAAGAEELNPEQAKAFVVGKLFSYTCFDGTAGMGRIFADGSVVGTIRPGGRGEMRFANLPPGTLRVDGGSMCAHLTGMMITPCFRVEKIDYRRFRGSLSGLGFAYCDFYQHNARAEMISRAPDLPRTRMTSRVPPAAPPPVPAQPAPVVSVQSAPMAPPQPQQPAAVDATKPAPAGEVAKPVLQPGLTIEAAKPAPQPAAADVAKPARPPQPAAAEAAKPAPAQQAAQPAISEAAKPAAAEVAKPAPAAPPPPPATATLRPAIAD
jgi:hypothetical protein